MLKVIFKKGKKENLPTVGAGGNELFFVEDTGELFKSVGKDAPLVKFSDVEIVTVLPDVGKENKIYILNKGTDIRIYIWDKRWITLISGGVVADDRVDILFNLKNKKDVLTYDNGNIVRIETSGEVEEVIDYEYDGENNVTKEIINRQGKVITNTFSYDGDGNIIEINTIVV